VPAGGGAGTPGRRRIAVIGPNATLPRGQGGGSATVFPPHLVGPADGLRAALGADVDVVTATGVRAEPWPAPLTVENSRDPVTGEPGLRLRFLDEHGGERHTERRLSGRLLFMDSPALDGCAWIEATALVRADVTGRHPFGLAGMGPFELRVTVDGVDTVLFDGQLEPPDGDFVAGFLRPSVWWDGVELTAGQEVLVTLRHGLMAGIPLASFGLLAERPSPPPAEELAAAVELAASAHTVVVVVGTSERAESEGVDRTDLGLPAGQDDLVRRVAAANPRTVVVVNAGAPVLLPWRDEVPAVLLSWFPGAGRGAARPGRAGRPAADHVAGPRRGLPGAVRDPGRGRARLCRGHPRRLPRLGAPRGAGTCLPVRPRARLHDLVLRVDRRTGRRAWR
jgi:beta-glucosidase